MHSRIFQLEEKQDNIVHHNMSESDLEPDWDCPGNFVGEIADYVNKGNNKQDDINWFREVYKLHEGKDLIEYKITDSNEIKSVIFKQGFKQSYFEKNFNKLKDAVKEMTIDNFCDCMESYKIGCLIEDKYGFYIYSVEYGWTSFDSFIRDYMKEDTKYYFGNVLDYHY